MRLGIIGCGQRMQTIIRNIAKCVDVEIAFIADPSTHLFEKIASDFKVPDARIFDDLELIMEPGALDLVLIGSPNHLHLEHLDAARRFNTKIFCEKPAVLNREQSLDLARRDVAGDFECGLVFGFVLRFAPLVKHLTSTTRDQQIVTIEANELLHPEHGSYIMRNWRRRSDLGGSLLLDKACHDLDLINLLARGRPATIASFGENAVFKPGNRPPDTEDNYQIIDAGWSGTDDAFGTDKDIHDAQVAILKYPSGTMATFLLNSHAAMRQRRLMLTCRDSLIRADFETNSAMAHGNFTFDAPQETKFPGGFGNHYGADDEMAQAVVSWVEGKGTFGQTTKEAIEAGLTVMMIDEAAATNQAINTSSTWDTLDEIYNGASPS